MQVAGWIVACLWWATALIALVLLWGGRKSRVGRDPAGNAVKPSGESTSPIVATKASRVLREGERLKAEIAAYIDDAQSAAASALTRREPHEGRRLYAVEVIGYNVAWRFEQLATPEQAASWREDGLHIEEIV